MKSFLEYIIEMIITRIPFWMVFCLIYTIGGMMIGLVGYISGVAMNLAVDPIIIILGGIAGFIGSLIELFEQR